MSTQITQRELETYLWGAAVVLRGLIDAGDYKQYIFPLVFLKWISDVYDEEQAAAMEVYGEEALADLPENHRFAIPDGCHWDDIRSATSDIGATVLQAMPGNAQRQLIGGLCASSTQFHTTPGLSSETLAGPLLARD